ncbi:MAG TPA: peptidase U32 family protein, partial [Anaerolineae bacterium]|nr:peptidase U32 family protein [Anaerolineae bacterium]
MDGKQLELLAPAGNRSSFEAAINNGADAIYLGIDKFSARRQAENFPIGELADVVREAHLRDVRVYVAFNTLISDDELPSAVESLAHISNAGVDSVIVQDWGILRTVKHAFPELGVHTSTQMNTHNVAAVKLLEQMGVNRITLARELSIDEIVGICSSTDVPIETFIHGALCFSYSGQCLFSSMVGNRSGNRGLCPQACRMSYTLVAGGDREEVWPTPGNHLLSTRDLCGMRLIPELARAGVRALKIEGRMKSPEYVATVVRVYRHAIDRYFQDPEYFSVSEDEIDELREA